MHSFCIVSQVGSNILTTPSLKTFFNDLTQKILVAINWQNHTSKLPAFPLYFRGFLHPAYIFNLNEVHTRSLVQFTLQNIINII